MLAFAQYFIASGSKRRSLGIFRDTEKAVHNDSSEKWPEHLVSEDPGREK
jgi:hypothetical protein